MNLEHMQNKREPYYDNKKQQLQNTKRHHREHEHVVFSRV